MDERIKKELGKEEPTKFHARLLDHCKALVNMSRDAMSSRYTDWDTYDQTYRGERMPDKEDCKAKKDGAPVKMVVPITYSQVQTAVAYCFAVFYQKERLIELQGTGPEDHEAAKIGEALLERDFQTNIFDSILFQWLVDIFKFGIGVVKSGWVREEQMVEEETMLPGMTVMGFKIGKDRSITNKVRKVKYQGNRLYNVSPYRFYPDTRLPLARFQEGEFCASEDEYSMVALKRMEQEGTVAGLEYVKAMTAKDLSDRGDTRFSHLRVDSGSENMRKDTAQSKGIVLVVECQVTIIPSEFMLDDEKPLGPSKFPEKWNVWYANDKRVIKAEPLGYPHDMYTFDVVQFSPDQHKLLNQGLAEITDPLQSVISWFINSHITSVRKVVQNRLVVDPEALNMDDVTNHRHIIRVNPGLGKLGLDRFVHQLQVQDVTQNHIGDVDFLHKMVQVVTGVNDNALGQFHTGRRSATEARAVTAATAARLNVSARLTWKTGIETLAGKMLANHRAFLDVETAVKVLGEGQNVQAFPTFRKVTKESLVGDYDFAVYDGTTPSDKMHQAEVLKELLLGIMSNPEFIPYFGYDPRKIMREMLELRGIRNPERFRMEPEQLAAILETQGIANGQQQAGVGEPGGAGEAGPVGGPGAAPGIPGAGQDLTAGLVG